MPESCQILHANKCWISASARTLRGLVTKPWAVYYVLAWNLRSNFVKIVAIDG